MQGLPFKYLCICPLEHFSVRTRSMTNQLRVNIIRWVNLCWTYLNFKLRVWALRYKPTREEFLACTRCVIEPRTIFSRQRCVLTSYYQLLWVSRIWRSYWARQNSLLGSLFSCKQLHRQQISFPHEFRFKIKFFKIKFKFRCLISF